MQTRAPKPIERGGLSAFQVVVTTPVEGDEQEGVGLPFDTVGHDEQRQAAAPGDRQNEMTTCRNLAHFGGYQFVKEPSSRTRRGP